ncbi:MAG TPA: C2H2-type zinc finger protein [Candidatus Limnocylindrales bacterium]
MAIVTAYCHEAHGLKLGPGTGQVDIPGQLIVFRDGYATFDTADYPDFERWLVGAPPIRILDSAEGEVAADDAEFKCPVCGKGFKTEKQLNGHLMSHKPKEPKAPAAPKDKPPAEPKK